MIKEELKRVFELLDKGNKKPTPELNAHHHPDGTTTLQSGPFIHCQMLTQDFEELMAWPKKSETP